MVASGT